VDADTGWGTTLMIGRTVREMIRAGAAGMHIEDQVTAKRCGHRPGKAVVPALEMMDRIKAAVDSRTDPSFVIMARTDAFAIEGLEAAIDRACLCREAGADMIFPEALVKLDHFRRFVDSVGIPVLANLTEFGQTPLLTVRELAGAGVALALYPLSAFRAMSDAALRVYRAIREEGTQSGVVNLMQTREELYRMLDYHAREGQLDQIFAKEKET
jgi:methylisocitrate lyase